MRFIFLLIIVTFLNSCTTSQEVFEGTISFRVSTLLKDVNNPYKSYFLSKYGDSIQMKISKDGSFRKEYFGKGTDGFEWHVYDRPSNMYYAKWKGLDTIYYYNCGEILSELKEIREDTSGFIMGSPSRVITVSTFDPVGKEDLIIAYHYNGNQTVDSAAYSDYKEGYMDKVYARSKSHILKYEMSLMLVNVVIEAVNVIPGSVDRLYFKIPESTPRRQL